MAPLQGLRGILFDIDGTLLQNDRPIPGVRAMLDRLRASGLQFRLATNTTRRSRAAIASVLAAGDLPIPAAAILTPSLLARRLILASGRDRAALLIPAEARVDLEGVVEDERNPDWVVLGDLGRDFTFDRLNAALAWLRDGARLLALQKNRYWYAGDEGWVLDAGAFVTALEYAAGVEATIVGKPSTAFFDLALEEMGLQATEVLVVGDDVETDLAGGRAAGCRTALVKTGKYRGTEAELGPDRPDLVLESAADLL